MLDTSPITVKCKLNASIDVVWNAITNPVEMKNWYFDLPNFQAKNGYKFSFKGGKDDRIYNHLCEIIEVEYHKKISYTWCYEGFKGFSIVTFEILNENGITLLQLTHSGIHNFSDQNPDFAKENFITGWNQIIMNSFKSFIDK